MTVQNGQYSARADHRRHDRLLVARYAMDDAYPGQSDEATQLVAACAECAQLAADVRVIAASMKELAAPARPRDFTISQEQAHRLRGSPLTQLLRGFASPGWATLRPVAGVALSIGLVMAVVGSVVPNQAPAAISDGDSLQVMQTSEIPVTQRPGPTAPALAASPRSVDAPGAAASPDTLEAPDAVASPGAQAPEAAASLEPAVAPDAAASPGRGEAPAASPVPALAAPGGTPAARGDNLEPELQAVPTQSVVTRNLDNVYTEKPSPDAALYAPTDDGSDSLAQAAPPDFLRNVLIYAGLAIALISFALLALAWGARRYFADPLLR